MKNYSVNLFTEEKEIGDRGTTQWSWDRHPRKKKHPKKIQAKVAMIYQVLQINVKSKIQD